MARKQKEKPVEAVAEPEVKPVRLALTPEYHRLLRLIAADANTSMANFAQTALVKVIDEEVKARSIRR